MSCFSSQSVAVCGGLDDVRTKKLSKMHNHTPEDGEARCEEFRTHDAAGICPHIRVSPTTL